MNLFKVILIVFVIAGFLAFILLFVILRALGKVDSQQSYLEDAAMFEKTLAEPVSEENYEILNNLIKMLIRNDEDNKRTNRLLDEFLLKYNDYEWDSIKNEIIKK
jgi:hypothetical protein